MSGIAPIPTQVPVPNTFAVNAKSLATESAEIQRINTETGYLTIEQAGKAVGLDYRVRSAFKNLAKLGDIREHSEELNDLSTARVSLIELSTKALPIGVGLQKMAAEILHNPQHTPNSFLSKFTLQDDIANYLPAIHEEVAKLVGTNPGDKTLADHGKALFEDEAQDRATIAQALFNVANQLDTVTQADLLFHNELFVSAMKADDLCKEVLQDLFPEEDQVTQEDIATGLLLLTASGSSTTDTVEMDETERLARFAKMTEQMEAIGSKLGLTKDMLVETTAPASASTEVQPTQVQETDSVKTEVQPAQTEVTAPVQTEVQPTQVQGTDPVQTEVQPTQVQGTAPVQTEAQPTQVQGTAPVQTEVQPTQVQGTAPVQTEVQPAQTEVTAPVQTEVQPAQTEVTAPVQTEALPAQTEVTPPVQTEVQPTQTEVTTPVQTEAQPSQEEARAAMEELQAAREALSKPDFNSHGSSSTVDVDKMRQLAEQELHDEPVMMLAPVTTSEHEKLAQEIAVSVADMTEVQTALLDIQVKIAANNAIIEKEEGAHITLSDTYKATQQNVARLKEEEANARQQVELSKQQVTQAQAFVAKATEDAAAAQANFDKFDNQSKELDEQLKNQSPPLPALLEQVKALPPQIWKARDLVTKLNKEKAAAEESLAVHQKTLDETEQRATVAKQTVENAETESFRYPMQIADVVQRIETAKQEIAKLTLEAGAKDAALIVAKDKHAELDKRLIGLQTERLKKEQLKDNVTKIYQELLRREFYIIDSALERSAVVIQKIRDLPDDVQEMIKERVFEQSPDTAKTREDNTWINAHIGEDLGVLYQAFDEAQKALKD